MTCHMQSFVAFCSRLKTECFCTAYGEHSRAPSWGPHITSLIVLYCTRFNYLYIWRCSASRLGCWLDVVWPQVLYRSHNTDNALDTPTGHSAGRLGAHWVCWPRHLLRQVSILWLHLRVL